VGGPEGEEDGGDEGQEGKENLWRESFHGGRAIILLYVKFSMFKGVCWGNREKTGRGRRGSAWQGEWMRGATRE
jgi:hypothetical protein